MSFYLKKSVSVGPFRFNLSKSGVGMSAGVKGLRVGTGPRGNYVHMGRGGIYYRKTLSPAGHNLENKVEHQQNYLRENNDLGHEPLKDIESGDINELVDSSSADLVNEINLKRKKYRFWPLVLSVCVISSMYFNMLKLENWIIYTVVISAAILVLITSYYDKLRKTTVILYDFESDYQTLVEKLHDGFDKMINCSKKWHLEAEGKVTDKKYQAGADKIVRRKSIKLNKSNPPYVKTNIRIPNIPVGKQTLYFFPDKVLIFEPNGVGAVSYENLNIVIDNTEFIENEKVPSDAKVVGRTWQYVNKKGGPDKRFSDNREIPIALYEDIIFKSDTGLNERIELSKINSSSDFVDAIYKLTENLR